MSNPDSPSCLLPSAKCGWGHAECSLLCRPDGSCKIEQFCLLKHQLFSKISISSLMAARLLLLRARPRWGSGAGSAPQPGPPASPEAVKNHCSSSRAAEKPALLLHSCAGHWTERLLQAPRRWSALSMAPHRSHEVRQSSSPGRSGTRSAEVCPRELKLSSLQDVVLTNLSTRSSSQNCKGSCPDQRSLGFICS